MNSPVLGGRIRRLREERRLTQPELALALGVSAKTVSNWESGRNVPRSSLGALNKFFGVDLEIEDVPDPVEAAVRRSGLVEWRQDAVLSFYKRNLYEQGTDAGERPA